MAVPPYVPSTKDQLFAQQEVIQALHIGERDNARHILHTYVEYNVIIVNI